jgi:hypothetical protein
MRITIGKRNSLGALPIVPVSRVKEGGEVGRKKY